MATTTKINAMKKGISNRFEDLILSPQNYKMEEQQQDIKNVFCMEGGQGESSYINNSQSQSRNLKMMLYALEETLDKIQLPRHRPGKKPLLTAADLGCSCGHNTLLIADVIVDHMTKLCGAGSLGSKDDDGLELEFCFYFCDLASNDFNTLFHLLPQQAAAARRYFAAAIPGSFYDRLFPERSINVFTSTLSLHWLSQVPEGVADKRSPAYNKGKVFVHGASEETGTAYRRQFRSDMMRFLHCRAAELKTGGAIFIVSLGRLSSTRGPTDQGYIYEVYGGMFDDSWCDLIEEGMVDGEKMDSFNVPLYAPTVEEFKEVVDADGSFKINQLELVMASPPVVDDPADRGMAGRMVANYVRALLGPLIDTHIGGVMADELFIRMQRHAEIRAEELVDEMCFPHILCSLSLMQKVLMKDVFCMEGGQGESSYIKNSQVQSRNLQMMLPTLKEILDKVQLPHRPGKHLLTAADLGCSCGHNTLIVADAIVEHMTRKLRSSIFDDQDDGDAADPEFCFYFSDLPSNDFNTLFHLLPQHATAAAGDGSERRYFAAAVPGSFHDRLFPKRSIDVFTSTFSLHWLSQVPEGVADKRSAAYNKDKVFVHGASQATGAAYRRQFQSDMARFLRCRATELKAGGVMFLVCLGRPSLHACPTNQGRVQLLYGAMFEESWGDLVEEGTIGRETMGSFNVPVYAATLEEFGEAVGADGSFEINRLELVMGSPLAVDDPIRDRRAVGRAVANYVRSLLGPLVDAHVGRAVADEIFVRMQRRAEARAEELVDEMRFPHIDMKNVFCMKGGQGESSYLKNSKVQFRNLQMMLRALEETLDKVVLPHHGPGRLLLTAADLGCSCGRNTLVVADAIVQHMTKLCRRRGKGEHGDDAAADPEFCFYFSDLPSNDFNTLFGLLPHRGAASSGEGGRGRRHYFAAAVPGSFHDRLFPERSIDVFTSTFCLHWLSQVPEEVADKWSPAYNKEKVFVHGGSEETGAAYRRQFQSDMARFLCCRAAELKPGGAMFLVFLGRPSSAGPTDQGRSLSLFGAMFEESWRDLVGEGLIDGERMDSFNVPSYAATLEEFREVVDADGSFEVNRLELVMGSPLAVDDDDDDSHDRRAVGRTVANNQRSVFGPLVEAHIGKELADELFVRVQSRAEALDDELVDEMRVHIHIVCSLSLV
uniref:Jasmonate O-methyltransferase n=1 Tax=Oryza glumipatula TaxID=40148 RepID=A0A0D9ZS36_9ORYZ